MQTIGNDDTREVAFMPESLIPICYWLFASARDW